MTQPKTASKFTPGAVKASNCIADYHGIGESMTPIRGIG
jgi:hypothetical protein